MTVITYFQQIILLGLFSFSFLLLLAELNPERGLELAAALIDLLIFTLSWGEFSSWKDFRNYKVSEDPDLADQMPENVIDLILFHDRYMNSKDDDDNKKKGDKK